MILLAIDTASTLCAACVYDATAGRELGRAVRDIGKGHAEQLMGVIDEALQAASKSYADINLVGVSVGPGSFTGIRVGVAAARGLALALKIPVVGVTTLEALAAEARNTHGAQPVTAAIDAGRDGLYVASYDAEGGERTAPLIATLDDAVGMVATVATGMLCGSAAARIAEAAGAPYLAKSPLAATADIGVYAKLAAAKPIDGPKPKPLYLRAPDAKPQAHAILARK